MTISISRVLAILCTAIREQLHAAASKSQRPNLIQPISSDEAAPKTKLRAAWTTISLFAGLVLATASTQAQTVCALTGCTMTGPLVGPSLNGVINAATVTVPGNPTPDIGQRINQAYINCPSCEIDIPAGTYPYSNPITLTVGTGTSAWIHGQGQGTTILSFTGASANAMSAISLVGNAVSALKISDLALVCTGGCTRPPSTSNGLVLEGFNGGIVENVRASSFPADCLLNEGDNAVEFYSDSWLGCKNGIHNVAVTLTAGPYSANALHFYGGEIADNTQYGVYEDGTGPGPNENNQYMDIDFEPNGTTASTNAQIFIQLGDSMYIANNYMEPGGSTMGVASIVLGDSAHQAVGTVVLSNFIGTPAGGETIDDFHSLGTYIAGNAEDGAPAHFELHGALSRGTILGGGNNGLAITGAFIAGYDNGLDTLGFYPASNAFPNAIYGTIYGTGFNAVNAKAYYANGTAGVSKTCTTYPTVVNGLVTSC